MKTLLLIALMLLTGCVTPNFEAELSTYKEVEAKRSDENIAKYTSLGTIAKDASDATKQVALQAWQAVAMADTLGGGGKVRAPMPQAPATAFDKTLQALSIVAPVAASITGNVMTYKLGIRQAEYSRDVALGDQRARVDTVTAVTTGMGALGASGFTAATNIANAGFASATALGNRPTTVVNGNGNSVNGSTLTNTTTTQNTNNCATGAGGSGVPGSSNTNPTEQGVASAANTGLTGAQSGNSNCTAGK